MLGALLTILAGCGLGAYEVYKSGKDGNINYTNRNQAQSNEFGLYYDANNKTRDAYTGKRAARTMDHRGHWIIYDVKTGGTIRDITDMRNAKENEESLRQAIAEHKRFYKVAGCRDKYNTWKDRKTGHYFQRKQQYSDKEMRWVSTFHKYNDEWALSRDGIYVPEGMYVDWRDPDHFIDDTEDYME